MVCGTQIIYEKYRREDCAAYAYNRMLTDKKVKIVKRYNSIGKPEKFRQSLRYKGPIKQFVKQCIAVHCSTVCCITTMKKQILRLGMINMINM